MGVDNVGPIVGEQGGDGARGGQGVGLDLGRDLGGLGGQGDNVVQGGIWFRLWGVGVAEAKIY